MTILEKAIKILDEFNIKTEQHSNDIVRVNRDDMMKLPGNRDNQYDMWIKFLQYEVSDKLYWTGKDDNWFYLKNY